MSKIKFIAVMLSLAVAVGVLCACHQIWTQENADEDTADDIKQEETMKIDENAAEEADMSEQMQTETEALSEEDILNQTVESYLAKMTLEEKVAQMFVITPEALTGYGQVTSAGDVTRKAIEEYPVGGLVFLSSNMVSTQQVTSMMTSIQEYACARSDIPMFLCVDEEGGTVSRIGEKADVFGVEKVGNMCDIGASGDVENARNAYVTIGTYLNALGINVDFAPVADVLTNSENQVVRYRSFGSDALMVSDMVRAALDGLESQEIIGVLKHFPGHGATSADTHEGYAYTNLTLDEMLLNEMVPFIDGIDAGADMIMTAHISCPNITGDTTPCTLSKIMITDILRGQLGYDGIVITDAMNMGAIQNEYASADAAVKAIDAGVDIILMPADFKSAYQGVLDAVAHGTLPESRIDDSVRRILKVKIEKLK